MATLTVSTNVGNQAVAVSNDKVVLTSAVTDDVKVFLPKTGGSDRTVGTIVSVENQSTGARVVVTDNVGRVVGTVLPESTGLFKARSTDRYEAFFATAAPATPKAAAIADISTATATMSTAERTAFNSVLAVLRDRNYIA